jgi:hypothetical protein
MRQRKGAAAGAQVNTTLWYVGTRYCIQTRIQVRCNPVDVVGSATDPHLDVDESVLSSVHLKSLKRLHDEISKILSLLLMVVDVIPEVRCREQNQVRDQLLFERQKPTDHSA